MLLTGCGNRLPDSPGGLPYVIEKHGAKQEDALNSCLVDLNGDGSEELVTFHSAPNSAYYYLAVRRIREDNIGIMAQYNKTHVFRFSGTGDVDGDGNPEVFTTRQVDVHWAELTALDIEIDGDSAAVKPLERARPIRVRLPDTLIDGRLWNGILTAIDVSDGDGDGWNELVTFASRVGLARGPRGIGRGNLLTGEVVWFTRFAGGIDKHVCVADLDDDGEDEYAASFNSPGNGVVVGDMTDSEAYVAAIDGDGTVMWRHRVAGLSALGWPYCRDVTRDGRTEVISWQSTVRAAQPDTSWLSLRDGATGELLGRWPGPGSIHMIALGREGFPGRIYVASADGRIRRLQWLDSEFVIEREIDCGATPRDVALLRVDPFEEPVVVCMTAEGTIAVMDTDLKPLALLPTDETHVGGATIVPIDYVEGHRGFSVGIYHGILFLELHRAPLTPWVFVVGALALVILCCVGVPPIRRTLLAVMRRLLIPRAEREKALDELLGALVRAGHGKLAATSTLRRLTQQFSMLAGVDGSAPEQFAERYREALANVREIGVPGIVSIQREAARIGLEPSVALALLHGLAVVRALLGKLPSSPPTAVDAGELLARLEGCTASLDSALESILVTCRGELSCRLINEIRRSAGVRRSDFMELGAELVIPAVSVIENVRVFGTRTDVSFIIENL
ncbi:VCBS repeat-containing protein, partial [bacterium]|nr:VCBS repeat-containing protein [bacterium]